MWVGLFSFKGRSWDVSIWRRPTACQEVVFLCPETVGAGEVARPLVAENRKVGLHPATPPRKAHGLRVVGLPAERRWIRRALVSRYRARMAVDGTGRLFFFICHKTLGPARPRAIDNARPKPVNSHNGRPARPPSTGHAIPEGP